MTWSGMPVNDALRQLDAEREAHERDVYTREGGTLELLGVYLRSEEDAVVYLDETMTERVAPADCVEVVRRR